MQARMEQMRRVNVHSTPILAQVGAALTAGDETPSRASASGASSWWATPRREVS